MPEALEHAAEPVGHQPRKATSALATIKVSAAPAKSEPVVPKLAR